MNVQTYLFFPGTCEEALELYARVLGAEVLFLMRFLEAPPALIPPDGERMIFHATIRIGESVINASDDPRQERGRFGGFALLVHFDEVALAEEAFSKLSEEGEVLIPMGPVPWADRYGIVQDRFGVTWKFQVDRQSETGESALSSATQS